MTYRALPPLNALLARSSYAVALMIAVPVFHLFGVDLLAWIALIPAPAQLDPATDRLVGLVTAAAGIWAYCERRNPKRSIDWTAAARSVAAAPAVLKRFRGLRK